MTLIFDKACKGCGASFVASRHWSVYCSSTCKFMWERAFGKAATKRRIEMAKKIKAGDKVAREDNKVKLGEGAPIRWPSNNLGYK